MGSNYSAETNALLKMKVLNPRLRGGAALMLALWALFLLSAMIISWALDINSRLVVSGNAGRVLDAEAMASSGGDIALAEVALRPKDAPLTSVDDLKKICGWAEFTSKPGWDKDFTVCDQCNQGIDVAWASRDVLRALGIGDDYVDRFLQLRAGPDGVDGTADDTQFISVQDALTRGLGLNSQQISQLQNLIGFSFPVFRVVSIGKSGDVTRTVQMIVSGGGGLRGHPLVISWKEL